MLNPIEDEKGMGEINAVALAAGNVTAGSPFIVPILSVLPVFEVVLFASPLLSNQTPVAIFEVALESAPSNHKEHPGTSIGLK
jgi:hypothetical protein